MLQNQPEVFQSNLEILENGFNNSQAYVITSTYSKLM